MKKTLASSSPPKTEGKKIGLKIKETPLLTKYLNLQRENKK